MLEIASQMILCLLLAALLGFIIGYLFGKMTCASDECGHEVEDPSHGDSHTTHDTNAHKKVDTTPTSLISTTTESDYTAPETLNQARNGIKDDLTQIKGLNAGLEASLNNHGIYHYDQIATWSDENEEWVDNTLKLKGKTKDEDWVGQAKNIDSGNKTTLSTDTDTTKISTSSITSDKETTHSDNHTPQVLSSPRNGEKDNLSKIKGVGMKIEDSLNAIGIYHFDQIADWTERNIEWADNSLGFPGRANREKWVEQAKLLASGGETEFSKRVDAGEVESSK